MERCKVCGRVGTWWIQIPKDRARIIERAKATIAEIRALVVASHEGEDNWRGNCPCYLCSEDSVYADIMESLIALVEPVIRDLSMQLDRVVNPPPPPSDVGGLEKKGL